MRKIKFYTKKTIKYIFALLIIALLVVSPVLLLKNNSNNDNGLDVIDKYTKEPELIAKTEQVNTEHVDGKGYKADFNVVFDEEKFNGYEVTDYLIILNKNNSDDWVIDQNDPLYWTKDWSTIDEVESSVAYQQLQNSTITIDDDTLTTEEEIEAAKQELIKNHILNNENHFSNDASEPLVKDMYVADYYWTLNAWAKFETTDESNTQTITKQVKSDPIKLLVQEPTANTKNSKEKFVDISAPVIDFDRTLITQKGIGSNKQNVIERFIYTGDPNGNLSNGSGYSTVSNFTNLYSPRFRLDYDALAYLEIFNQMPTISLEMYASEDTSVNVSSDDILLFDTDAVLDSVWGLQNKTVVFNPIKLSSIPGMYTMDNTLTKEHLKLKAELNYSYKTEEEIVSIFQDDGVTINFDEETKGNLGKEFNYDINNSTNPDNYVAVESADEHIFDAMARFDKSDMPDFAIYPNWDDAGRFNIIFATTDQYIFNSPKYGTSNMEMNFYLTLINERTGVRTELNVVVSDFDYIDTEEYGRVFYTEKFPSNAISSEDDFYVASDTKLIEQAYYESGDTAHSYDQLMMSSAVERYDRENLYSDITFTNLEDFEYDGSDDGITFVLSDNIHEITAYESPSYLSFAIKTATFLIFFVILPLLIYIILVLYRKSKERLTKG